MIALMTLLAAIQAPSSGKNADVSRKEAERTMAAFLRCEVKSTRGRLAALAYTREVAGTPSTYPRRLIASSCAPRGTQMRMNPELVRLSLFSALYERDYARAPLPMASASNADYAKEFDGTPAEETLALRRFGDCVVGQSAAESRALVLSKLYSEAEQHALTALRPAMAECLTAGQRVSFSRTVIRGAVAEALYKLSAVAAVKVN